MNLYVGNMSYDMSEKDLEQVFAEFGSVVSVKIITDRDTGRAKGFGFVEMETAEAGQQAIKNLDGKEIFGRNLRVNEAKPREERPRRNF